jgi:hypothetical protein
MLSTKLADPAEMRPGLSQPHPQLPSQGVLLRKGWENNGSFLGTMQYGRRREPVPPFSNLTSSFELDLLKPILGFSSGNTFRGFSTVQSTNR